MKKSALILAVIMLAGSLLNGVQASAKVAETQTFKGTVESVSSAKDVKSGNISEIVAVDAKGQTITFLVRSGIGITVSGSDRLISLKNLENGDKVIIEYTTAKEGVNKIMTIECSKPRGRKSY